MAQGQGSLPRAAETPAPVPRSPTRVGDTRVTKSTASDPVRALREQGARYVVGVQGQPVAVLLTLEEYERYLDLLDDEADSQDAELSKRLTLASARKPRQKRLTFRDYVHHREAARGPVSRRTARPQNTASA
jgi:PHD/YefM family antitoxin component YafN of YafNO toxin-antitoxin module